MLRNQAYLNALRLSGRLDILSNMSTLPARRAPSVRNGMNIRVKGAMSGVLYEGYRNLLAIMDANAASQETNSRQWGLHTHASCPRLQTIKEQDELFRSIFQSGASRAYTGGV